MKMRKTVASMAAAAVLSLAAACGIASTDAETTSSTTSTTSASTGSVGASSAEAGSAEAGSAAAAAAGGGPGGSGTDASSVSTEAELIALIQEAYGDAGLDLHRGHQPVQDVLDAVLTISHDELHVRMNQGQNLAAVATDLGIDPQTLINALVEAWSPAIDSALAAGAITEQEATAYRTALEAAFTFRVTWDGQQQTPTFSGLDA